MTPKKKSAPEPDVAPEAAPETEADPAPEAEAAEAPATTVTLDGLRATDTYEDGSVVQRDATFAEQVAACSSEVLRLAVGTIPHARGGSVECDGNVVTLTLAP